MGHSRGSESSKRVVRVMRQSSVLLFFFLFLLSVCVFCLFVCLFLFCSFHKMDENQQIMGEDELKEMVKRGFLKFVDFF